MNLGVSVISIGLIALLIGATGATVVLSWNNITGTPTDCATGKFYTDLSTGGCSSVTSTIQSTTIDTSTTISTTIFSTINIQMLPPLLTSNLVGYWPLDEGTGTSTYDLSGNGNTGTLENSPTWESGSNCKFGDCLSLNSANNQFVSITAPSTLNWGGTTPFTISLWFYLPSATTGIRDIIGTNQASNLILEFRYCGTDGDCGGSQNEYVQYCQGTGSGNTCFGTLTKIQYATWYYASFGYDGTNVFFYLNGVFQSGGTMGEATTTGTILYFGIGYNTYATVSLDDVRIYNVALTSTQVLQLYTYGLEYHN
jgi:hypothetical protein